MRLGTRTLRPEGAVFVDIQAGYHPRSTRWRWSAGTGVDQHGVLKSRYDHGFGVWEGTLPGGLVVRDGVGIREYMDAVW